jgi:hypothetical protein
VSILRSVYDLIFLLSADHCDLSQGSVCHLLSVWPPHGLQLDCIKHRLRLVFVFWVLAGLVSFVSNMSYQGTTCPRLL